MKAHRDSPNSFSTQPRPISLSVKRCSRKHAMEGRQQEEIIEEKVREEVNNWLRIPLKGNPEFSPNLLSLEFRNS